MRGTAGTRLATRVRPLRGLLLLGLFALPWGSIALARDHDRAPPLAAPAGAVVEVATEAELQAAVRGIRSDTTIVIAPGTYELTRTLAIGSDPAGPRLANVAIRGATANPADVVLAGKGMRNKDHGAVPHGIHVGNVDGILIANLTIGDVYYHAIQLAGEMGCRAPRVYNCRLIDSGEQLIKGSVAEPGKGVESGVVEYSRFEYTTTARGSYTNGVDILGGSGWVVRHNLFRRIVAPRDAGLAGPAVLFWRKSRDTIVEGNRFIDCAWGIALGLDPATPGDHSGGVVRNNFVARSAATPGDVGIAVFNSPRTKVLHNTVLLNGTYANAIEYRFAATTGVEIRYNLCDAAIRARDGSSGTVTRNAMTAQPAFFVDPAAGDLHIKRTAPYVIDWASPHPDVTDDFDGDPRPRGTAPDLGADELDEESPPPR